MESEYLVNPEPFLQFLFSLDYWLSRACVLTSISQLCIGWTKALGQSEILADDLTLFRSY
jgi:hypothetical protein